MNLYLIKRELRPDYHKAPYHPVILCAQRDVADWEAGCTCRHASMWFQWAGQSAGWLLMRWIGTVVALWLIAGRILAALGA